MDNVLRSACLKNNSELQKKLPICSKRLVKNRISKTQSLLHILSSKTTKRNSLLIIMIMFALALALDLKSIDSLAQHDQAYDYCSSVISRLPRQ